MNTLIGSSLRLGLSGLSHVYTALAHTRGQSGILLLNILLLLSVSVIGVNHHRHLALLGIYGILLISEPAPRALFPPLCLLTALPHKPLTVILQLLRES